MFSDDLTVTLAPVSNNKGQFPSRRPHNYTELVKPIRILTQVRTWTGQYEQIYSRPFGYGFRDSIRSDAIWSHNHLNDWIYRSEFISLFLLYLHRKNILRPSKIASYHVAYIFETLPNSTTIQFSHPFNLSHSSIL